MRWRCLPGLYGDLSDTDVVRIGSDISLVGGQREALHDFGEDVWLEKLPVGVEHEAAGGDMVNDPAAWPFLIFRPADGVGDAGFSAFRGW